MDSDDPTKRLTKKPKKDKEPKELPHEPVVEKDELKMKKDFIKEEKKLEKKKEKEEKRKLKEEERLKEKEVKKREKEEKRMAEQKRVMRKERRRSFLKQGGATVANIESTIEMYNSTENEEKPQHRNPKVINSPEVLRRQRELEQFLLNMPLKKLRGTTWKYYDIAPSNGYKDVMLLLHAGGIRPEAMWEHILSLAQGFRVVCPWFPEYFSEIDDYVAGLFLIMRNESIKRVHLFGIGFGAILALHFLYRHPSRVISCAVTSCTLPSESKIRICEKALKKMDFSNGPIKRLITGWMVKQKDIEEHVVDLTSGERDLWIKNLKKFAATKQAVIARIEAIIDYHTHFNYTPEEFSRWQGKLLLIDFEDDEYYDSELLQQIKSLFSDTVYHSFPGTGHLLSLIRGKVIGDLLLRFILDEETYVKVTTKPEAAPEDSLPVQDAPEMDDVVEIPEEKKEKKKKEFDTPERERKKEKKSMPSLVEEPEKKQDEQRSEKLKKSGSSVGVNKPPAKHN